MFLILLLSDPQLLNEDLSWVLQQNVDMSVLNMPYLEYFSLLSFFALSPYSTEHIKRSSTSSSCTAPAPPSYCGDFFNQIYYH